MKKLAVAAAAATIALPLLASASSLSVSCSGVPATSSITWTGTTTGGIAPFTLLWSNGSTSTSQTVAVAPGTYSMTFQATDASSSVATTTCSATVATPATTTPSTTPSIADQITALLSQIAALKAQIAQLLMQQALGGSGSTTATSTPSTATSTPGCFAFNHDIERGDEGDDVRNLQTTLASDPSVFSPDLVTGFFGEHTFEALKKFQEKHGIRSTGYFGSMSRTFFEDQCGHGDSNHDGVPDSLETEDHNGSMTPDMNASMQPQSNDHGGDHGGNSHED